MRTFELDGHSFRCLEGCGFCCTFQPEVSTRELALLRKRFAPQGVAVVSGGARTYLALQNKCGACTLLERRNCTAYDLRPAHCRYFPFHVHFADETEAYVNYTCRGVERAAGSLASQFEQSVLSQAKGDDLRAHEQAARSAYGEFQRRARRARVWGDVAATAREALALGTTRRALEAMLVRSGEGIALGELHAETLDPFGEEDVTKRPFYLAPDLTWLTFERAGEGLRVLEMDERGTLLPRSAVDGVARYDDARVDLSPYLARLVARRSFAGSVYALVDDAEYERSVEHATWWRLASILADLHLRARILRALATPEATLADECARFYDSTFLDAPTIGGWL